MFTYQPTIYKMSLLSWLFDLFSNRPSSSDVTSWMIENALKGLSYSSVPLDSLFSSDPAGLASMVGSSDDGSSSGIFSGSRFDPYAPQISTGSDSPFSGLTSPYAVRAAVDDVNAAMNGSNESASADTSFDFAEFLQQLLETEEEAARHQAQRNEDAAYQAYLRSEVAAENAMFRARVLRQTQYQDIVSSLKEAGLNPVLAVTGGLAGSSTTAPMANAPSSSSSAAGGVNIADLLIALASLISAGGNLLKGLNPTQIVKNFFS